MLIAKKCRYCGKDIVFIRTHKDRVLPCDANLVGVKLARNGLRTEHVFYSADGLQAYGWLNEKEPDVFMHEMHFVHCRAARDAAKTETRKERKKRREEDRCPF